MTNNTQILVDLGQGLSLLVGLPTIASWNTNNKPAIPKQGTLGFNLDTKKLEYYDGSSWFEANMDEA